MCPRCCVEYNEAEVDIDCDGTILHNVKVLQCPNCGDEQFTPEQHSDVLARIQTANENAEQKH